MSSESGPEWISSGRKRAFDILLSSSLSPLGALAAAAGGTAIYLEGKSSPSFSQVRMGKDGTPFRIHKIRTMDQTTYCDSSLGALDPRATRVGSILRRLTIDETPQLYNILAGEMSVVGPRTLLPADIKLMQDNLDSSKFSEWHEA